MQAHSHKQITAIHSNTEPQPGTTAHDVCTENMPPWLGYYSSLWMPESPEVASDGRQGKAGKPVSKQRKVSKGGGKKELKPCQSRAPAGVSGGGKGVHA